MEAVVFDPISYRIDLNALAKAVRIDPDDEDMLGELRALAERAGRVAAPKAICRMAGVNHTPDGRQVADIGGVAFRSQVMDVNLHGVSRVFAYVATCGAELDTVDTGNDPLAEYWLDAIRLQAVGHAMRYVAEQVTARYRLGKTARMNPGSLPDWPISEQPRLFSLIGDVTGRIGVQLTPSFLMRPLKSVSGILFETAKDYENCMLCPREDCPNRRAPYNPEMAREYDAQTV